MNVLQVVQAPKRIRYESGSNANGTWQITYENDVIVRVWQKLVMAVTGNGTVRTLPISIPDADLTKLSVIGLFYNTDFVLYSPLFTTSTFTPTLRTASTNAVPSAGNMAFVVEWVKV